MSDVISSNRTITAVPGVSVGHAVDHKHATGSTVVLFSPDADMACDPRGGWPGTFDTHSIDVAKRFTRKHALFLTGGDVFGLDCATGLRRFLLETGRASAVGAGDLPGVVGADIYDIKDAGVTEVDYSLLAYTAAKHASTGVVAQGKVGAGLGATVGKFGKGLRPSNGGCGSYAMPLGEGLVVGALVVTNALGNVYDKRNGKTIAGARNMNGEIVEYIDELSKKVAGNEIRGAVSGRSTTIGLVATNIALSHEELVKVSQMAHDGLAMSVRPVHMSRDGDTIFAASTTANERPKWLPEAADAVGSLAAECVAQAVVNSVKSPV